MYRRLPLKGLTVIEFAGLAPAPFCGMILADFGARVIRIDRPSPQFAEPMLARGKESICIDVKKPNGIEIIKKICQSSDIIIEPFRKGVMERNGLGPNTLLKINSRLIYARLTGFGQTGVMSKRVGHDINFLAMSGVLSKLGRAGQNPHAPINLLADFAGGSLMTVIGILVALHYRTQTGVGQVVDNSMTAGAAYLGSFLWNSKNLPGLWGKPRGKNLLDGGVPFYDTYETSDGKYMAVGALEPNFYSKFLEVFELNPKDYSQYSGHTHLRNILKEKFLTQTQKYWTHQFGSVDACCTPVLSLEDAAVDSHNQANKTFIADSRGNFTPSPAPLLSESPASTHVEKDPVIGEHTCKILKELEFTEKEIGSFLSTETVVQNFQFNSKL